MLLGILTDTCVWLYFIYIVCVLAYLSELCCHEVVRFACVDVTLR